MNRKFALIGMLAGSVAGCDVERADNTGLDIASDAKVIAHVSAFKSMLDAHPEMAVDLSDVSGEYCMNTWKVGGTHMTHHAIDTSKSAEDVIDFVPADTLAGILDVAKLPKMPAKLGAMQPNQWYYLAAGDYDPHHQSRFDFALLIRATNVQ